MSVSTAPNPAPGTFGWLEFLLNSFEVFWQKGKVLLLGSGAEKCKEVLCHDHISFDEGVVPSSSQMAHLAYEKYKSSEFEDVAYFEPYYLKDFILQQKKK